MLLFHLYGGSVKINWSVKCDNILTDYCKLYHQTKFGRLIRFCGAGWAAYLARLGLEITLIGNLMDLSGSALTGHWSPVTWSPGDNGKHRASYFLQQQPIRA